jgi:YD repeat-containing protein
MINVATGALHSTPEEISIPGKVDLVWERTYNTALLEEPIFTALGLGWTTPYFATLTQKKDTFEFVTPQGTIEIFEDSNKVLNSGDVIYNFGNFLELHKEGNNYIITNWNVDTGDIKNYIFKAGLKGKPWPLTSVEDVTRQQGLDLFYDSNGRLATIQQRLEKRRLSLQYTIHNQIHRVSLIAPEKKSVILASYDYDTKGRLVAAYDALGHVDRYKYDDNNQMIEQHRKSGGVFILKFDPQGRCIKASGQGGYDEKRLKFFDLMGYSTVTDSRGMTTQYHWKPSGQVTREIDPLGRTKQTEYDDEGRIIAEIAPNGGKTTYEYDKWGNRCQITDPLGNTVAIEYNHFHLPVTLTDPAGKMWQRRYDTNNRLTMIEDPLAARWQFHYDNQGNLIKITDPNGAIKRQSFSANGILTETTDWEDHLTRYVTDALGRITERIDPLGAKTRFKYDLLGNPLKITFADDTFITCQYDNDGNLTRLTDANGQTTRWEYGTCSRLFKKINPLGYTVHYHWGTEPNVLEAVVNEKNEVYYFTYNEAEQVIKETGFDGRELVFEYDLAGDWVATINGIGETISYQRDALGRLMEKKLPKGASSQFEYDHFGNLIAAINNDCKVTFERDALGRVIKETQDEYVIEHEYDLAGNLVSTKTSLDHAVKYQFDGNGALIGLTVEGHDPIKIERDALGQEISRLLPGGVELKQEYDKVGQLVVQQVDTAERQFALPRNWKDTSRIRPKSPNIRRQYQYDKASNLIEIKDGYWGTTRYTYDAAERLIQAVREQES